MKLTIALLPAILAASAGYLVLHPGVAFAEPRFRAETPFAQGASFTIDPNHSGVYFEIEHLELSKVTGRLNKFTGKITEHGADLTKAKVEFSAEAASIDTAIPARDDHLRKAEFFDVEKHPKITFKSTRVEKKGRGYVVTGDLTIKGKSKSVAIPFRHLGPKTLNFGETTTHIGIVADPIVIKRTDFGVGDMTRLPDGTLGASDEVVIRISFEAIRDK